MGHPGRSDILAPYSSAPSWLPVQQPEPIATKHNLVLQCMSRKFQARRIALSGINALQGLFEYYGAEPHLVKVTRDEGVSRSALILLHSRLQLRPQTLCQLLHHKLPAEPCTRQPCTSLSSKWMLLDTLDKISSVTEQ